MRERWLADLGRALEEARALAAELRQAPGIAPESAQIAQSIDQAISRVASLRRGQPVAIADILGSKWFGLPHDRVDRGD